MHAALDAEIDEAQIGLSSEEILIRNRALLHYIATLASSNSDTDTFSYSFVQSLIDGGGNLNEAVDMYGQTMFHEVARSWDLGVAKFLLENGTYKRHPRLWITIQISREDLVKVDPP